MRTIYNALLMALVGAIIVVVPGCDRDIGDVVVKMLPTQGCVPLQVEFVGDATLRAGVEAEFHWSVGAQVALRGARVTHTFRVPGTYDVELTVISPEYRKTQAVTIEVRSTDFPSVPGVYWRQECNYQPLLPVAEQSEVIQLGKTSLEDLETRIVGRSLSLSELVTHPLWRRPHTHMIQWIQRQQFTAIPLDHFHAHGFVAVGEAMSGIVFFRLPPGPEPAQGNSSMVLTHLVDSWELETLSPELQPLRSTFVAQQVRHYLPDDTLTEGLYFIDFKTKDDGIYGIRPVELVGSQ